MWQSEVNWTFMTLFFEDQTERVSQIFSLQPSQAVKETAVGSLSPHYTSSQQNAAFSLPGKRVRALKSSSWGPPHMAVMIQKPQGTVLIVITVIVPHSGAVTHSSQSFYCLHFNFHDSSMRFSFTHSFNRHSASYLASAFREVGIIVLLPIYLLVIVFIQQTLLCVHCVLGTVQVREDTK